MRALAALALLAACTTTPAPAPVTRISYEQMSWGYVQERWSIHADGATTLELHPEGATLDTPANTTTHALTPADFERVRAALAPAEAMLKQGVPCEREITDAPYGAVRWTRADGSEGAIRYDYGCRANARLGLLYERMGAANVIVHEATGIAEPR